MFNHCSTLKLPKSTLQPLWRYMSAKRFHQLLTKQSLYFCSLSNFSDGLEGKLTARTEKRFLEWQFSAHGPSYDSNGALLEYMRFQKEIYASCWHLNQSESYLMWKAYAKRGFAIKTTYERACASFDKFPGQVSGGVVDYLDFSREETAFGNIFTHSATKDLPYSDEREYRFLVWQYDPANSVLGLGKKGHSIQVDLNILIEKIYMNPFHKGIQEYLKSKLNKLGLLDRLAESGVLQSIPETSSTGS